VLGRIRGLPAARRMDVRGNTLLVAIGETAARFARLAPAVWKGSTVKPPAPAISPESHPLQAQAPQGEYRISARLAAAH
jgi:hypothetical protein